MATLLDDIRHEIVKIKKIAESTIEEGIIEPLTARIITTVRTVIRPPLKPWFGVVFTNDGPASVWLIVNSGKSNQPQELRSAETWGVTFKTAVIVDMVLYTEAGTASVRIRGSR